MWSQRRIENNAVWCERSEAALFDSGVRKAAFYVGGLLLPREVFWKRILAKSRSLRWCGCQCERVHWIMRRERPNNALGWWCPSALSCSVFKPHFPKCGDPMLGVKANRSALEYSSSKADELKVEFSAEWLRIWRYERGISVTYAECTRERFNYGICTFVDLSYTEMLYLYIRIF